MSKLTFTVEVDSGNKMVDLQYLSLLSDQFEVLVSNPGSWHYSYADGTTFDSVIDIEQPQSNQVYDHEKEEWLV